MGIVDGPQPFDGDQMLPDDYTKQYEYEEARYFSGSRTSYQRKQTCIDSHMVYSPSVPRIDRLQDYGARSTTALATAQLGTFRAMLRPDKVEESPLWVWVLQLDSAAVHVEVQSGSRMIRVDDRPQLLQVGWKVQPGNRGWQRHEDGDWLRCTLWAGKVRYQVSGIGDQ